jgi:NAD(P)-dependent dehydrogenase (short-subunit alcohol dehydrogenase family)
MTLTRTRPADGLAWVTGASSGIGRELALQLARSGWRVAVTARRLEELQNLGKQAADEGHVILPFVGDVTDRAGMARLIDEIEAQAPIALAVLNVGTFFPDDGAWFGDAFRKTFDVNLGGTLNGLEPLVPKMIARGRGQVAIMASVAGYAGLPRSIAYSSSKSALIVMAQAMRFMLEPKGVGVQVICPGFVETPLTDKNDFPMPFLIKVEDAARRICEGLVSGRFEIAVPRRMVWLLKAINLLPYRAYFWLVGRGTGQG